MRLKQTTIFILLAATTVAFAALTYVVLSGVTAPFDEAGVLLLRTTANPNEVLGGASALQVGRFLTHFGDSVTLAIITLIASGVIWRRAGRRPAIWLFVAAAGSFIITAITKAVFGRARPDIVERFVEATSASYPSGHTLRSAVVYSLLIWLVHKLQVKKIIKIQIITVLCFIILINGISRIYLGVHWPTDILGAWLIAFFWLTVCYYAYHLSDKTNK